MNKDCNCEKVSKDKMNKNHAFSGFKVRGELKNECCTAKCIFYFTKLKSMLVKLLEVNITPSRVVNMVLVLKFANILLTIMQQVCLIEQFVSIVKLQ